MQTHRHIRSFVLRAGRMTPAQERALAELWPAYGIDVDVDAGEGAGAGASASAGASSGALALALAPQTLRQFSGAKRRAASRSALESAR
jgi:tRNA (guanine-N7-)-methyltransferase